MKSLIFILLICNWQMTLAQSDKFQINEQVWKPFIQAFEKQDADMFLSLHTKDLMRIPGGLGKVIGYEEYLENNRRNFIRLKENKETMNIAFRFTRRVSDGSRAFEEGYFKATVISANGSRTFFGRFTVGLRKRNNVWKIFLDADSSEGMTEEIFLTGEKMDE